MKTKRLNEIERLSNKTQARIATVLRRFSGGAAHRFNDAVTRLEYVIVNAGVRA